MMPDKDLTDDVLDEIIAGAKTSMEQYLALSLKAERAAMQLSGNSEQLEPVSNRDELPPNSFTNEDLAGMAHGDNPKANAYRELLARRLNSPVTPDGWVMVPVEPTKEMIEAGWLHFMGTKNPSSKGTYKAMLEAAPKEVG